MSSSLSPKKQKIYVTSNGWHTGIVLNRKFISPVDLPEIVDLSKAEYVEFGWGAIEVDDENWTVQLHNNGSSWGHLPLEPH